MNTQHKPARRFAKALAGAVIASIGLFGLAATASAERGGGAGGVTGPAFYVDGELYRTVGTPTDFSGTGAPAHTYDIIYDLGPDVTNVAESKPGDRDYNGGRWQVHAVSFDDYDMAVVAGDMNGNGILDSAEEVEAAIGSDHAVDNGVVKSFLCPVIPIPGA
jgi:hypothetical protein